MKYTVSTQATNTTAAIDLCTVEADSYEKAAHLAAAHPAVKAHFGASKRAPAFGTNRETGTPGKSGLWSLWASSQRSGDSAAASNQGAIHIW